MRFSRLHNVVMERSGASTAPAPRHLAWLYKFIRSEAVTVAALLQPLIDSDREEVDA
jgi:hypothetical protein